MIKKIHKLFEKGDNIKKPGFCRQLEYYLIWTKTTTTKKKSKNKFRLKENTLRKK